MRNLFICFSICILISHSYTNARGESLELISISNQGESVYPTEFSFFFKDTTNSLSISDVLELDVSDFDPIGNKIFNERASSAPIWIRFQIKNELEESVYIDLGNAFYTWNAEIFIVNNNAPLPNSVHTGTFSGSTEHKISNHFIAPLNIENGEEYTVFVKLYSEAPKIHVFKIGTLKHLIKEIRVDEYAVGGFITLIICMFLYNLFLYISVRESIYLFYLFHLTTALFNTTFINGNSFFTDTWFWEYLSVWVSLGYLSVTLFTDKYLQLKVNAPKLRIAIWSLTIIIVVIIPLLLLIGASDRITLNSILQLFTIIFSVLILSTGMYLWIKGHRFARFYVLGWSATLLSLIMFILLLNGIIPINDFTMHSTYLGVALEALLFAFALGDRINALKQETEQAQLENLELVTSYNEKLEKSVEEKTRALNLSQQQLINSEKMASLGMMAGGISHEINNPLNIIQGGVFHFKNNLEESGNGTSEEDFEVLDSMTDSIQRVARIVKALNVYNRFNEVSLSDCDIHYILDGSISLFQDRLDDIEIVKEYDVSSKIVKCDEGKLHQIFINIISNSVDAVAGKGRITITTAFSDNEVKIVISDDGPGITNDSLQKIFDPFYTTKGLGKGTGLGLSITQNIVIELGGSIEVSSQEGEGASFTISFYNPEFVD